MIAFLASQAPLAHIGIYFLDIYRYDTNALDILLRILKNTVSLRKLHR
nr:MAG TPA: hypothetical protein [Caudoviricetes sp.]